MDCRATTRFSQRLQLPAATATVHAGQPSVQQLILYSLYVSTVLC